MSEIVVLEVEQILDLKRFHGEMGDVAEVEVKEFQMSCSHGC